LVSLGQDSAGSRARAAKAQPDWISTAGYGQKPGLAAHRIINRPIQPCDEASGCPGSCIFRCRRPRRFGLPLVCILRRFRRRIFGLPRSVRPLGCTGDVSFELPRLSHPSAPLRLNLRVTPNLRSHGCASGESPGCPESCTSGLPAMEL